MSIHIFRRDLRLEDNSALIAALQNSVSVMPVFIFDDRQLSHHFKGNNSFTFMVHSLQELDSSLREKGSHLYVFNGIAHEVISEILSSLKVDAIFVNRDYTPFSRERDSAIAEVCAQKGIEFSVFGDALLNEPEQVHKPDGLPYTVFTPFMKKAKLNAVPRPVPNNLFNYFSDECKVPSSINSFDELIQEHAPNLRLSGGRNEGLELLHQIEKLEHYELERNLPAIKGTSLLSAHHKFGTISIRETYYEILDKLGKESSILAELHWRDFFTHIVYHFPNVLGHAFKKKYETITWENDKEKFEKWCNGLTGFPIVDAGMRELVETGYMHNRVRMIVASFLVKDLHIDWCWGERFFAKHLIDYDPAVNNGNWQWSASTGCDAQPYFRIFNPWNQQLKFDPECIYIKHWIPEIRELSAREIHNLEEKSNLFTNYPRAMVVHSTEASKSKLLYKQ